MKNKDFEKMLAQSLQDLPNESNWQDALLHVRSKTIRRCRKERVPFRVFMFRQIRYIGWKFWGAQGLLLLLFDRILAELYGERFWDSPSSVARLLFCVSTLVAMMALPLLYRSRKFRMQEVESASYFSSTRLLMARLAVIGIGDSLLLMGMFLATTVRTSMQTGNLTFYLFLPFLIMSAAYLFMMGHCSGNGFFVGGLALGSVMLLLAVGLPGRYLPMFQQRMTLEWLLFCCGLLAFSAEQLRYLLYRSPYSELQLI